MLFVAFATAPSFSRHFLRFSGRLLYRAQLSAKTYCGQYAQSSWKGSLNGEDLHQPSDM